MTTDFLVSDHGSIVLLTPITEKAGAWADEHIDSEAQTWGASIVVERNYLLDILEGLQADGLSASAGSQS